MTQVLDWTLKEFETLINLPGVPAGELSRLLGTRPADAIEVIRGAVHNRHAEVDGKQPLLARELHQYLDERGGFIVCAQCGAAVNLDLT